MSLRNRSVSFLASGLLIASGISLVVAAADDLADLKPGTKVITDVGGEAIGEVIEKVAADVYRVRVKIRTGDVIEPALPIQRLRLAPADTSGGAAPTTPKVEAPAAPADTTTPGTTTPGTTTPGSVAPGTVTPGTVTPGTVTPGTVTSGTITSGAVQGTVTTTPGTVTPGMVTPGKVIPGTVTQGTTPPVSISVGKATSGTVTPGTVTPGTVTAGTATPGTSTSGIVSAKGGAVVAGRAAEALIGESPAGKVELRSLVGTWNIVAAQRNGRAVPQAPKVMTIAPNSLTIEERVFTQVRLDPTSNPRRIDLATADIERPLRGIYKRDGDRLRMCLMEVEDSLRPTDFTTAENDGRVVYECVLRK